MLPDSPFKLASNPSNNCIQNMFAFIFLLDPSATHFLIWSHTFAHEELEASLMDVEGLYCMRPIQWLASSELLTPMPLTARRVCTPTVPHSTPPLAGWRVGWGVNSSEDARHCSVLYICKYFVLMEQELVKNTTLFACCDKRLQFIPSYLSQKLYLQYCEKKDETKDGGLKKAQKSLVFLHIAKRLGEV